MYSCLEPATRDSDFGGSEVQLGHFLKQTLAHFSREGPDNTYLGFAGHMVSVTATQLCLLRAEAAIDNT